MLLVAGVLLSAAAALAQTPANPVAAPPAAAQPEASAPDPAKLPADWWTWFAPAEPITQDMLAERVERTAQALDAIAASLDPLEVERREALTARILRTKELLRRYLEERGVTPQPVPPLPPPLERYTLEEAYARHRQSVALGAEITFERDEIDWRADLLNAERKQHQREKVGYLELPPADPERLAQGLELMQSRLQLELNALDVERRRARLAQLEEQRKNLAAELALIPTRLTATPDEAAVWLDQREKALALAAKLREQSDAAASATATSQASAQSAAVERLAALEALVQNAQALAAELTAARAGLAATLVGLVTAAEEDTDAEPPTAEAVAAATQAAEAPLANADRRLAYWRRTLSRLQDVQQGSAEAAGSEKPTAAEQRVLAQTRKGLDELSKATTAVAQERDAVLFTLTLVDERAKLGTDTLTRGWETTLDVFKNGWRETMHLLGTALFEINETPVTTLGLLRVLLILTLFLLASKGARRALARLSQRRSNVSQSSAYTLGRIVHYFLLAIGIVVALSSIGIDLSKFALLASALGIGIGFGLQQLVSNFVAGLIILFEKSLKIGDFVELQSGLTGEVREINMRSTLITTNDNVDILVPNSALINNEVTNWTLRESHRRIRIPFGVAYGTEKELVRKAGLEAAEEVEWTLKSNNKRRAPQVWLVNFGDSSLDFELVVWLVPEAVKRPAAVHAAYLWAIETKLRKYEIEIPFPQRDLHVRSVLGQREGGVGGMRPVIEAEPAPERGTR